MTGRSILDGLNTASKAGVKATSSARFRTKEIDIDNIYRNVLNQYSLDDVDSLARAILVAGRLYHNLVVVYDPALDADYRLVSGERRILGMSCEITPSKAETDGEIQWKDWVLKISTPVQSGTVRSKFAMDASSVTIDTGRLTFNSNTIVINSTNFKLDASGNVTASGTFKSANGKWEAALQSGSLLMNYDGNRRVELFKAGNYDGGYLRLTGTYGGRDAKTTYAPNYILMESASTENVPNYIMMKASEKGQSLTMTPEYISWTENSKRRFATELGKNNGVPVSNSAVVQSPDGDVMARLMCGNVLGAPQAKLEFYYKFDDALWSVMSLFYDGSKNRVTLDTGKNAELYIKGRKF